MGSYFSGIARGLALACTGEVGSRAFTGALDSGTDCTACSALPLGQSAFKDTVFVEFSSQN